MEGYSRKHPRKQLKLTPERWALSQAVLKYPQMCDDKRVSLVGKSVGLIDAVPELFKSIDSLHLSGNIISDISNIGQFARLKSLSLASNRLERLPHLMPLRALGRLENLNLEGNPVCLEPCYRYFLLYKLPALRTLDGVDITPAERLRAKSIMEQIESAEEVAVANEEQVAKLQHLLKTLKLHKQLLLGKRLVKYEGVEVRRLMETFQLNWPNNLRQQVLDVLRLKVKDILSDHSDDTACISAYSDCIVTQQELITRMVAACEDQAHDCRNLWVHPQEKGQVIKKPPTPVSHPLAPTQSRKGKGKDYSDVQTRYHNLIHPKGSHSNSSSRSNSVSKRANVTSSLDVEERPQQLVAPVQDCEKPRKWSDAEEQTQKIAEQNRLLRLKLKEFEEANHQNVATAEMELSHLNEKLRKALEDNERLKEMERGAQEQLANISILNEHLEDRFSHMVYTNEEQNSIQSTIEEGLSLVISKFRNTKLLQRVMRRLVLAVQKHAEIRRFTLEGRKRQETEVGLLCLAAWKWLTKTAKYVQFKSEQKLESKAQLVLIHWKRYIDLEQKSRVLIGRKRIFVLKNVFFSLSNYPLQRQDRATEKRVADSMKEMHLIFRVFSSWKEVMITWKISTVESNHLNRQAEIHNRSRVLRMSWVSWLTWRHHFGVPERMGNLRAYSQYADSLKRGLLRVLARNVKRSRQLLLSAHALGVMKVKKLAVKCLRTIKKNVLWSRNDRNLETRGVKFRKRGILARLKTATLIQKRRQGKIEAVAQFYRRGLSRKVLKFQRRFIIKRKQLQSSLQSFKEIHDSAHLRSLLNHWLIQLWRAAEQRSQVRLRRVFSTWYRTTATARTRKVQKRIANRLYVKQIQTQLQDLIHLWMKIRKEKKAQNRLCETLKERLNGRATGKFFGLWKDAYNRSVLSRAKVSVTDFQHLEQSALEQSQNINQLSVDNEQLRLQLISAEASIKEVKEAKASLETQLRNVRKEDSEAAVLISKLERDVSTAGTMIRQLQYEKEVALYNFEQQLTSLKDELKQRERDLSQAEQALVHASDFRREVAESTDTHVQEVVSVNDQLVTQLQAKDKDLRELLRKNSVLSEELKRSEAQVAELQEQFSDSIRHPETFISPSPLHRDYPEARPAPQFNFDQDSEPTRLLSPEEDQIREHLLSLKNERAAIREEIESRMKKVDVRQRLSTSRPGSDTGLLDISTRMASLEARLASKLK